MSQNFMQSKLPPIYNQKETVRQHLISYLIENLQVPKAEINVEQSLTYYDTNSKLRADIVIYWQFKNVHYPVAVIEEFPKYLDLLQGKYSPIPVEKFLKKINTGTVNTACKVNILQILMNNF